MTALAVLLGAVVAVWAYFDPHKVAAAFLTVFLLWTFAVGPVAAWWNSPKGGDK